ncbi:hypothetical protein ACM9HF_07000 [Colwellia sp. RE-S-Sl-9]
MKYLSLMFIALLTGCAAWFPANVHEVEEGVFTISAVGNSFASRDKMKEKINKKADFLCSGKGYERLAREGTTWAKQKNYSTGHSTSYQTMLMTIRCKD